MKRLLLLALGAWREMLPASLLAFLTIGAGIGLSYCSGYILTRAALLPELAGIEVAIVGVRFFGMLRALLRWLERILAHGVALRLLEAYRAWFYERLEALVPLGVRDLSRGRLYASLSRDIEDLEYVFVRLLSPPLVALASLGLFALLMGGEFRPLFVPYASLLGAAALLPLAALPPLRVWTREHRKLGAEGSALALEIREAWEELVVADSVDLWLARTLELDLRRRKLGSRIRLATASGEALVGLLALSQLLCSLSLAQGLGLGSSSAPALVALLLAGYAGFEAVQAFPLLAESLAASQAGAARLGEIAGRRPPFESMGSKLDEKDAGPGLGRQGAGGGRGEARTASQEARRPPALLELENLSFAWPGQRALFEGLCLSLAPGESLALVGDSGRGKTSLVNLLSGFAQAQGGRILLSGRNLRDIPETEVREDLAILDQFPALFSASIGENLRLGREGASDEELLALLEKLGLLDWALAAEPQAPLEAWIGVGGQRMSGGESQRLAAGRLLLRKPLLYILDEPAVHLDPEAETRLLDLFLEALTLGSSAELPGGRPAPALILISHREESLAKMDRRLEI